jgi:hypothetical protein
MAQRLAFSARKRDDACGDSPPGIINFSFAQAGQKIAGQIRERVEAPAIFRNSLRLDVIISPPRE